MPDIAKPELIWSNVLDDMRGAMTKATFEELFSGSVALAFEENQLIVGVRNVNAQKWIEQRWLSRVEKEVQAFAGPGATILLTQLPRRGKEAEHAVRVEGVYQDARNDIVQPHKHHLVTDYFRRQWLPLLGPTLGWTIIALRRRAYRNYKTGETRDGFKCTLSDLARESGVEHWRTISRALQKPCPECKRLYKIKHPIARHFVLEQGWVYADSKRFGHRIRTGTRFRVLLDDPLTPADQQKAEQKGSGGTK